MKIAIEIIGGIVAIIAVIALIIWFIHEDPADSYEDDPFY